MNLRILEARRLVIRAVLLLPVAMALAADSPQENAARVKADLEAVRSCRAGLAQVVRFANSRPDLFPAERLPKMRMLNRENKEEVWNTWKTFLDYSMVLDSIRQSYGTCLLIADRSQRAESFLVAYEAFLAQYRFSLELIAKVENDPDMHTLLDDAVPEIGLEPGSYTRLKFTFLNAARATEFFAHKTVWATTLAKPGAASTGKADEDAAAILKTGIKEGQLLTAENALELVKKGGSTAWFPVQKGVSIWMGDTKVLRKNACLITQEQIADMDKRLQPGDVLLERREWYMSNVGLPGFWPHAVLYVGTPATRKAFFADPEVAAWVKSKGQPDGDLETLLQKTYPDAYESCRTPLEEGHVPRILEAIGEGVLFTTMEHSAAADSLCALRPRLSKKDRAVAIFRAFHYVGRPYDYNFDFMTDSEIVCTELVYKSYQRCPDSKGLEFPLINILGRLATPANELVHQFDTTWGTPGQQYDLVFFLDGIEKDKRAVEGSIEEFRKSWKRPKWHVVTQGAGSAKDIASAGSASPRKDSWAKPLDRKGLPNLHKVSDTLYRGAQPDPAGFDELRSLGVKTVVNLRAFHSDADNVGKPDLHYQEISFKTWHPEEEDMVKFLRIVGDTNNAPVFVHCQHGADRTGTMCALYRIAVCGWDKEEAIREMTEGGFGFHAVWGNLVTFIRELDVEALRKKAAVTAEASGKKP